MRYTFGCAMTFRTRQMTSFMFSSRGGGDGKTERKFFGLIHIGVRRQEIREFLCNVYPDKPPVICFFRHFKGSRPFSVFPLFVILPRRFCPRSRRILCAECHSDILRFAQCLQGSARHSGRFSARYVPTSFREWCADSHTTKTPHVFGLRSRVQQVFY